MKVDKYDKFYKIHADDGKSLCTLDGTLLGSLIVIPPNDYLIGKYIEVDSTKNLEIPQEIIEEEIKNYIEPDTNSESTINNASILENIIINYIDNYNINLTKNLTTKEEKLNNEIEVLNNEKKSLQEKISYLEDKNTKQNSVIQNMMMDILDLMYPEEADDTAE